MVTTTSATAAVPHIKQGRTRALCVTGGALAASLALPLAAATTSSAIAGLIVMHLAVAAVVIPALARTARAR